VRFRLAVTYLQFPIQVCFSATVGYPSSCWAVILLLWFWTLTYDLTLESYLDSVKVNRHAKYLGQRSFSSKVIVRTHTHRQTHRTDSSTWTTKLVSNKRGRYSAVKIFDQPGTAELRARRNESDVTAARQTADRVSDNFGFRSITSERRRFPDKIEPRVVDVRDR